MTHPILFMNIKRKSCIPIDIKKTEQKYSAKYLGDFALRQNGGGWTSAPAQIYYVEKPKNPEHSHYFGLFINTKYSMLGGSSKVVICDASSTFIEPLPAVISNEGEIVMSGYQHDYHTSLDESVWIDGGLDYPRSNRELVYVKVQDGKFMLANPPTSSPEPA